MQSQNVTSEVKDVSVRREGLGVKGSEAWSALKWVGLTL